MNTITVSRCIDCGIESVPYFGMFLPCKANRMGSHQHIEKIQVRRDVVAQRLRSAYEVVSSFDRLSFDRHAPPEIKALLSTKRSR